ncbi:MAG: hypothetical protein HOB84_03285 [Candidatus Marinimicrobia bacterium]|jgi:hypothetical protein|nr:hypothetical protein [Candidatus Neomarinimicrobiota bacterium]MBT4362162.1 hypothetical protein [Candidatus Neomarinimicrobiota bacterium]MBT4713777.1 hypothetical protein [Candidatus Neomarinimicrobiota bacterium]MBT4945487.1 hypothetical protein [Candidatus Neomarinimicrobiota bacterium]MBT5269093.1 hypothetical protein [Candidatus Neomarinimicrobiota bacterium]
MIPLRVEYWSGGNEPELIHTFYSLDQLLNHYKYCMRIGVYGKNFYRIWYPALWDELRMSQIPSKDVLTAHWYRGLEGEAVA